MDYNKTQIFNNKVHDYSGDSAKITIFDGQKKQIQMDLKKFNKDKIFFGREKVVGDIKNDIVIDNKLLSRRHGYFLIVNSEVFVVNTNESNGTLVNGELIDKKRLKDGDVIRIDDLDNPRDDGVSIIFSSSDALDEWKSLSVDGKNKISIGRDRGNDIVLDHVSVSTIHAYIEKDGNDYYVVDNDSTNGLSVNGEICKSRKLKEKDVIVITNSKIIFSKTFISYITYKKGVGLDARNIVKTVKTKNGKKNISNHVSLSIKPGEFVAIIGGSGAGKTTFMNCISGYDKATSGKVIVNGDDLYSNYEILKNIIGYVPQQDIVYDNLKLFNMLEYAAKLRMPRDTSKEERHKRIKEVIDMVELTGREDTFIYSLSGGQKKRASIAVELLSDPNLFFLDEPTSGLDPGTERNLMKTMKVLASNGKTIILVTHNTLNLHLCDKIIFLGPGGNLCYCGSYNDALDFFGVDNLVDVYNMLANDFNMWKKKYAESKYVTPLQFQDTAIKKKNQKKSKESFIKQTFVLCERYTKLLINDRQRLLILLIQAPLLAFLISIVADNNAFSQYEMTKSILFALSCSAFWIGILNSIQEVCKERVILKREYMTGLRLTSYVLSKMIVLALLSVIQTFLLLITFVIFIGLPEKGLLFHPFIGYYVTTFLTMFSAASLGIFVSSIFKNSDRAMTVAPILLMPQILFSGLVFKLEGFSQKISVLATCRWSMEGYGTIANLNKLDLRLQKDIPTLVHEAESFFSYTKIHLCRSWLVLSFFVFLFAIFSVVSLRNIDKN